MMQMFGRLGATRASLPLALLSFAFALGLLIAVVVDSSAVGGPLAVGLAILFLLNGLLRLWLRTRLRRLPGSER